MKSRILVVGGSGFLGSHAADALTSSGHDVCIFDKIYSPWLSNGQEMVVGDILDIKKLNDLVLGCDYVYHFAGLSDLNTSLNKPIETARINVIGTIQLLEACRNAGVKRFIYASTMYVYSREGGFYRCSKQACEEYIKEYKISFDLDYTILRFGSLYGPRSTESNGLNRLIKEALKTKKIRYKGSIETMREYIHVIDMANACVRVLEENFKNQRLVITGQDVIKVNDMLHMIAEILGLEEDSVEFIEGEYPGHYIRTPYAYIPEIGKKYTPELYVDFGQGLLELIKEISQKLNS